MKVSFFQYKWEAGTGRGHWELESGRSPCFLSLTPHQTNTLLVSASRFCLSLTPFHGSLRVCLDTFHKQDNKEKKMEGGIHPVETSAFRDCFSLAWKNPYVLRLAFSAGIGGLLFGYDTGTIFRSSFCFLLSSFVFLLLLHLWKMLITVLWWVWTLKEWYRERFSISKRTSILWISRLCCRYLSSILFLFFFFILILLDVTTPCRLSVWPNCPPIFTPQKQQPLNFHSLPNSLI